MDNEPMIIFPVMGKWYDKIVARLKTSEFRACKPYWNVRLRKIYQALQENKEPIKKEEKEEHKIVNEKENKKNKKNFKLFRFSFARKY